MASDISRHILQREIQRSRISSRSHRRLYSSKSFVDDLDIVNELDGHSGCVNALSWSRSGSLLASGSDDRHLNIHSYQPDGSTKQFRLQTTVATGHTQNIFSVKFMPHSNDSTIVTCAGDNQVRVFDLNYTGAATSASQASSLASTSRQRGRDGIYNGVRYLSDGDTNARIYRSHADRAKRVVTEDSPYLFLTCSEDGEVRQWDTRQPSSYYPRASGDGYVPPPLISYRRFGVDLNTISCSGSQPHYIALGGSHMHCFLHDRRMSGRNIAEETGRPSSAPRSGADEDYMTEATRCVRRFAPRGERRVKRNERGHITACKISDARPHELIVSWSHDNIYKFDMLAEPNAEDDVPSKHKHQRSTHPPRLAKTSVLNTTTDDSPPTESALRIHFVNGQQEDIPIKNDDASTPSGLAAAAQRVTKNVLSICETMFKYSERETGRTPRFTKVLGQAAAVLSDLDELISDWTYPLDPSSDQVTAQKALRITRDKTRRFVQAAGVLARVLGGHLQTARGDSALLNHFMTIEVRSRDRDIPPQEQFCYDAIKTILLWLESGPSMLIDSFTRPAEAGSESSLARRLPIPSSEDSIESISQYLEPYLTHLAASGEPVVDFDRNPYQYPEDRQAYHTSEEAIEELFVQIATPFGDTLPQEYASSGVDSIDRSDMLDHWAYTVGRGLLYNALFPVDFAEIDLAFGGTGKLSRRVQRDVLKLTSMDLDDENDESGDEHMEMASLSPADGDEEGTNDAEHSAGDEDEQRQHEDSESDDSDEDDVPMDWGYNGARQRARERARRRLGSGVPCLGSTQSYSGHCNVRTVKDVNYYGLNDEFVVSGSDDGNFFIWDTKSGQLLNILEGDGEVVNVIQGHPYEPMLAVSGIDSTIKIFSPDNRARTVARYGEEVSSADTSGFSSVAWPHRPGRRRSSNAATQQETATTVPPQDWHEDDDYIGPKGLSSRRRMSMRTVITTENARNMSRGDSDNIITSSYLRLIARQLRAQRAAAQGGAPLADLNIPGVNAEEDEDGRVRIVLGDDCVMM